MGKPTTDRSKRMRQTIRTAKRIGRIADPLERLKAAYQAHHSKVGYTLEAEDGGYIWQAVTEALKACEVAGLTPEELHEALGFAPPSL